MHPQEGRSFFLLMTCRAPCGKAFSISSFINFWLQVTGRTWLLVGVNSWSGSKDTLRTPNAGEFHSQTNDCFPSWTCPLQSWDATYLTAYLFALCLQKEQLVWDFRPAVAALKSPWFPCTGGGHGHPNHTKKVGAVVFCNKHFIAPCKSDPICIF